MSPSGPSRGGKNPPRISGSLGLRRGSAGCSTRSTSPFFFLIMTSIAKEFDVSVTAVAAVLTFTLWLRLVGAIGAGWLGDRIGRKAPLMLSILWFSACNFIAGFSPSFTFLFIVRAVLGVGMGAVP